MYEIELTTALNAKLNMDPINGLKFKEKNDVKGSEYENRDQRY